MGDFKTLFRRGGPGKKSTAPSDRATGTCFQCGKMCHKAADCWSRQRQQNDSSTSKSGGEVKPLVCFSCREIGHKSPDGPKRKDSKKPKGAKRVQAGKPKFLADYELYAKVRDQCFVVTIDTGADITILPKEVILPSELTGNKIQGRCTNGTGLKMEEALAEMEVGGMTIKRRVGVAPVTTIDWTRMLSLTLCGKD